MADTRKAAGTAKVETPAIPRPGNGPDWDELRAATSVGDLAHLDWRAAKKGYTEDGQLRTAIREKIAELQAGG